MSLFHSQTLKFHLLSRKLFVGKGRMFSRYIVSAAQMGFLFTYAPSLYQAKSIKWQALEIKRRHPRIPLHCKQFPYFFKRIFKKVGKCSTCAQYYATAPHFPGTKIMLLIFTNRKNFANGILIYALFILQAWFRKHFQVFSSKCVIVKVYSEDSED